MKRDVTVRVSWKSLLWGLVGLIALVILWAIRPGYQPLLLYFYNNLIPWAFGLAAFAAFAKAMSIVLGTYDYPSGKWWLLTVIFLIATIFFALYCPAVRHSTIADGMRPEYIAELPATERVRFIPYGVAHRLMRSSKQGESHLQLGDIDPVDLDGQFVWIAPRVPNGWVNKLSRAQDGFLTVKEDEALPATSQPFVYGEGSWFYKSILWQLRIRHYGCSFPEIFYLPDPDVDGGGYMGIAPYVGWRWHWVTTVPYWTGVAVVHADGRIEDLTVEQALIDPRFEGQRLFPEVLTLWQAKSWAYKDGVGNAWFKHMDQVEIPRLAHSANQMPFLLPGNLWMVAGEPYGPSEGIFKLFFFDAHDGSLKIHNFDAQKIALGPNVAWGYAQAETPGYVWREGSGDSTSGTYVLVEARPIIKSERLYWMYSVTTVENTGIALTILVRDEDEILHFCSCGSLERWLEGVGGSDSIPCGVVTESTVSGGSFDELPEISTEELYTLIRRALAELEQRTP